VPARAARGGAGLGNRFARGGDRAISKTAQVDDHFPMQPPRALWEDPRRVGQQDILVSDRGPCHKLGSGACSTRTSSNTVTIANGMGRHGLSHHGAIRPRSWCIRSQGDRRERRQAASS